MQRTIREIWAEAWAAYDRGDTQTYEELIKQYQDATRAEFLKYWGTIPQTLDN
jgi:hypothetical protein